MYFFISHLIDTPSFLQLVNQYNTGIESINFSVSGILDEGNIAITRYQEELGTVLNQKPLILHGPFFDLSPASFDSKIKAVTMERFEETYHIAKELNASKLIFHTGFIPQIYYIEGWLQNSILFWEEFMSNKDSKITVCIENVFETDYMPIVKLIQTVNHPAFKSCIDIGHINAYSQASLEDWITNLGPFISHIHLHNNDGTKDEHLGLLNGSISIKECLSLIKTHSSDATITLEIYDAKELQDSLTFLSRLNLL